MFTPSIRACLPALAPAAAAVAAIIAAAPAAAQLVEKHPTSPPGAILQSVTVKPGATLLMLSGQLAAPTDPAKAKLPPAQLTMADYGDTRTQTISALTKIRGILAQHGMTMADVVKMTVFVAGDPKLGGRMDFEGMNAGFRTVFGTPDNPGTVARSTIQVAALAGPSFLVEIEVTAAR